MTASSSSRSDTNREQKSANSDVEGTLYWPSISASRACSCAKLTSAHGSGSG